ncbi:MAG: inositol oxygenase [Deltaproteobacteria bacterium]|nr:inositol oxygenase [Deltaproteobacteria bacterium]MBW2416389.1 inositol oxygenase [Deltaproteobacteria bacterium]
MQPLTDRDFRSDVAGLYRRLHRGQTLERARALREKYAARRLGRATVRERFEALAGIRDESDADLEGMSQLGHALQTANAIRRDMGREGLGEDWIVLGLIHDLGKILLEHGEPQEFVVGDTHPLGCAFSPAIRHAEFLPGNPDADDPRYATRCGIYAEGCGLDAVTMSYGHDEYLYWIARDHVPYEVAWEIRYHSFQSVAGEYLHLFDARDIELRESHMKPFARYDLYTKDPDDVSSEHLDEYLDLLERRFPAALSW